MPQRQKVNSNLKTLSTCEGIKMNSEKDNSQKTDSVSKGPGIITAKVSHHAKFSGFHGNRGIQGVSSLRPVKSMKRRSIRPTVAIGKVGTKQED